MMTVMNGLDLLPALQQLDTLLLTIIKWYISPIFAKKENKSVLSEKCISYFVSKELLVTYSNLRNCKMAIIFLIDKSNECIKKLASAGFVFVPV